MRLLFGSDTATASRATVTMGPSAFSPIPFFRCSGGVVSAMNTPRHGVGAPGGVNPTSSTYRILFGKSSTKTRGGISAVSRVASSSVTMRVLSLIEYGVSRSDAHAARPIPIAANNNTGAITLRLDTPAARMAMISPSDAIRPNPIRIPISTPNGIVNGNTGGIASASSVNTVRGPGLLPTSSLNSASAPCRNMTNVASRVPSTELVRISRNTYRPSRRTGPLPLYLRRRHQRQLRLLLFRRMQLQIVDQDGRRHHAGLGRE